ncbi:MAG: hypothetical protein DHS80DRAFT_22672 [Piptocephalis tieghemiana]|nr:MAG: hypothetical protein DHS80DRAFT_22672 [Piptocephalis tieghemiana]
MSTEAQISPGKTKQTRETTDPGPPGRCKAQEETEDTDTSDTSSEDEGEEVWEETQEADAVDKLEEPIEQLSKEEIEELLEQTEELKRQGNAHFGKGEWELASGLYSKAALLCPEGHNKERAIYSGNLAACDIKLGKYEDAIKSCTTALEADPTYHKALLRRAQAQERLDTWSALSKAQEDYRTLQKESPQHDSVCRDALGRLEPRVLKAQEREKEEMMGKLKDLGNSILGKFGLSTDNFQFTPNGDGKGGYSMNFKQ